MRCAPPPKPIDNRSSLVWPQRDSRDNRRRRLGLVHVMERVELVAQSDVPVLILGETGTARKSSHARFTSARRARRVHSCGVNCGRSRRELLDSQLFGMKRELHRGQRGASRLVLSATEGRCFSMNRRVALGRASTFAARLQDGYIERVGGQQADSCRCANRGGDAPRLAEHGPAWQLSRDLWYRINVFPIYCRVCQAARGYSGPGLPFRAACRASVWLAYVEPTPEDLAQLMNYSCRAIFANLGA